MAPITYIQKVQTMTEAEKKQAALKDDLLNLVIEHIDVPGLLNGVIDEILEPALLDAVAQSENKIDDLIVAALYPVLEAEVKKQIQKIWDGIATQDGDLV